MALDAVLNYETPLEEVVARLSGRRTCSACKAVYHHHCPAASHGGRLRPVRRAFVQREDDRPESIRVRMRAYEEANRPLTEYYGRSDRLVSVRASGTPEQILEHSLQALSEHLARRGRR